MSKYCTPVTRLKDRRRGESPRFGALRLVAAVGAISLGLAVPAMATTAAAGTCKFAPFSQLEMAQARRSLRHPEQ